jgi:hypothetical protein
MQVTECLLHMNCFFFQDASHRIIDSDILPKIRSLFSNAHQVTSISTALKKKPNFCLSFFQYSVPGVSRALSNVQNASGRSNAGSRLCHTSVFLFKLLTDSLPTIALQYKFNEVRFPLLYPSNFCVLCDMQTVESSFHALCVCPRSEPLRAQTFAQFESKLQLAVPAFFTSPLPCTFKSFFTDQSSYKRGLIPSTFHSMFLDNQRVKLAKEDFSNFKMNLQAGLLKCFHLIWEERNKLINQNHWSFGARVRAVYGV